MEWQPISTAPRDATPVLLYLEGPIDIIEVGRFCNANGVVRDNSLRHDWRMSWNSDRFSSYYYTPIFWMPLPDAPPIDNKKEPTQ